MIASDLMTTPVQSCAARDGLERPAKIMWEADCGIVPVVDADNRVIGIITDRDIAIGAFTQGLPLGQIPVSSVMAKPVHSVREENSIEAVEALMRRAQVRRVPVLDADGRLRGILSLDDLVLHAQRSGSLKGDGLGSDEIVRTLAAICERHARP